jgi:serine/threonine protein kinase
LALVAIAADTTLEQLIPQVDQWSFQKIFRTALMLASAVRDFHRQNKLHPNLQPRNIFINRNQEQEPVVSLVDDWPTIPLSSRYGRYPYIAPEICHDSASISQASNIYSLGVMLWQLASGVIFPSSVSVTDDLYGFTSPKHIDDAYLTLIKQCLSRKPVDRPTAEQVCDALVRILMADMACPSSRQWIQQHVLEVRDTQSRIAKYLAMQHAKQDLHDLMRGASISKRMMMQVQVSLERHWHYANQQKAITETTTNKTDRPLQRVSTIKEEHDLVTHQGQNRSRRRKKRYVYKTSKNDSCNNIYGADLSDLMQLGLV